LLNPPDYLAIECVLYKLNEHQLYIGLVWFDVYQY